MAVSQRQFQETNFNQLKKCVRWCQNYLNLRDWNIDFYEGVRNKEERSCGWTILEAGIDTWYEKAEMWVNIDWCKKKNTNPFVAVCHEAVHVLVMGKCRIVDDSDNDEYISYAFQDLLYQAFCKDTGIKVVPMQDTI
jgi:hypothetical protein